MNPEKVQGAMTAFHRCPLSKKVMASTTESVLFRYANTFERYPPFMFLATVFFLFSHHEKAYKQG